MSKKLLHLMHIDNNDNHANLVSATVMESQLPCQISRFADAESGLAFLTQNNVDSTNRQSFPDMILLDLGLPGIDGIEFLTTLRTNDRTRGIPVVVLTTSNQQEEISKAYKAGANSYIVKPASMEEFVIKLAEMSMYWSITAELPELVS